MTARPDARALLASTAAVIQSTVRFGVSGHRDLADRASAAAMVTQSLSDVLTILERAAGRRSAARAGGATAGLGFQIVSPLAEGADRVVAELVLSNDPGVAGRDRELVVPLPFPVEYYRGSHGAPGSDCSDADSQREFDRLRAAAFWTRSLHDRPPVTRQQRDDGYREVGEFVARHSDLLIALWDGTDNHLKGGTADVVKFALERGIPVIWIPVTRQSAALDQPGQGAASQPQLLMPQDPDGGGTGHFDADEIAVALARALPLSAPRAASALAGRRPVDAPVQEILIERLGRLGELRRYALDDGQAVRDLDALLAEPAPSEPEARRALAAITSWIAPPYVLADGLARHYQHRLRLLTIGVYAASATAVGFGAFAAILFTDGLATRIAVAAEATVLAALLAVQWLDVRKTLRDRWVAFRAMSEYLRIGRYLGLVTPSTSSGLDFNRVARLNSWSSEPALTPWFAPVLERLWDRRPDTNTTADDIRWMRDYIGTHWIDDQISYHKNRRDLHRDWDRHFHRVIQLTLGATVLGVLLHLIGDYVPGFLGGSGSHSPSAALAFCVILLTSISAAFNGYAGQQRHSFHQARFRRMARELSKIGAGISRAETIDQLRQSIAEVRRITLGEATDWFEDMRDQELDSPT